MNLRPWAVRCSLLIAAASAIATSQPRSPAVVAEYSGAPFVLTHEAGKVSRSLVISISPGEAGQKENEGLLSIEGTARWRPANSSAPGSPWLTTRVSKVEGSYSSSDTAILLETEGVPVQIQVAQSLVSIRCQSGQTCEFPVTVEFEFQGGAFQGAVEMEWRASVSLQVVDENKVPKNYAVTLTER
ncbi:hypothetical protein DAT35_45910 [Vitiosangium sp. GDMCC 1.1324]|nr:hypothetical protein DAT35_45910 [Vitiosangium sp. GDMCC 1.1324]